MIDAISTAPPKHAIATTNNISDKPSGNTKTIRPDQRVEGTTTKTVIEKGKMILEEYDRHGRLIRKTPPGYLPVDEKI